MKIFSKRFSVTPYEMENGVFDNLNISGNDLYDCFPGFPPSSSKLSLLLVQLRLEPRQTFPPNEFNKFGVKEEKEIPCYLTNLLFLSDSSAL